MAESPFVLEGEEVVREGESRIPAVVWEDFDTVSSVSSGSNSSIGVEVYVNGSSQTASYASGAPAYVGNVQTLPTITFPTGSGGLSVVVEPVVNANGQAWKTGIIYRVLKPGARR